MSAFKEFVGKLSRADGYSLYKHTASEGGHWFTGVVKTPLGYVRVYAEPGYLMLAIILDSYEVSRVYRKTYTERGIVTIARRFIEEHQP